MIIVPVRLVEEKKEGIMCRLGSEPTDAAPEVLVPKECILNSSSTEGTDFMVLVLNPNLVPNDIKKILNID